MTVFTNLPLIINLVVPEVNMCLSFTVVGFKKELYDTSNSNTSGCFFNELLTGKTIRETRTMVYCTWFICVVFPSKKDIFLFCLRADLHLGAFGCSCCWLSCTCGACMHLL